MRFSYDGTNYFGYQKQPNQISIQKVLEKSLSLILRNDIKTIGAGRTDTGVHAAELYVHFDYEKNLEKDKFIHKLNSLLPYDIAVQDLLLVKDGAHARFDAISRTYKYNIVTNKNPFKNQFYASYCFDLDLNKMNKATEILFDYEDFTSFAKLHSDNKTNICEIYEANWIKNEDELIFTFSANRFLRNMVRSVVGTLIDVGRDKISIEDFREIIEKKDRKYASTSAYAKGLILHKIKYPEDIFL